MDFVSSTETGPKYLFKEMLESLNVEPLEVLEVNTGVPIFPNNQVCFLDSIVIDVSWRYRNESLDRFINKVGFNVVSYIIRDGRDLNLRRGLSIVGFSEFDEDKTVNGFCDKVRSAYKEAKIYRELFPGLKPYVLPRMGDAFMAVVDMSKYSSFFPTDVGSLVKRYSFSLGKSL